jgi:hypothetical protein
MALYDVTPDILLSTGRVVVHSRQANGSQLATPTPGYYAMTPEESMEYCAIRKKMTNQVLEGELCATR